MVDVIACVSNMLLLKGIAHDLSVLVELLAFNTLWL